MVLDASIALAWAFAEDCSDLPVRVLGLLRTQPAVVPAHWALEVTSGLRMATIRKRLVPSEAEQILERLATLPMKVDEETFARAFAQTWRHALDHRLTPYDAAYLELALRRGLPLATMDENLRAAAREAGAAVLE